MSTSADVVLDGPCGDCGRPYPPWWAPHDWWNRVMSAGTATDDPGGLLCPTCFLIRAAPTGTAYLTDQAHDHDTCAECTARLNAEYARSRQDIFETLSRQAHARRARAQARTRTAEPG